MKWAEMHFTAKKMSFFTDVSYKMIQCFLFNFKIILTQSVEGIMLLHIILDGILL